MTISCTLVRSVVNNGFFAATGTPVRLEGLNSDGKVKCVASAVIGSGGEVRREFPIEVLPEDLRFEGVSQRPRRN